MTNLFQLGDFRLHSGEQSRFKIDCDALTDADLEAIAYKLTSILPPFGGIYGIPRGGTRLARALEPYIDRGPILIVDDVLTTGASMEEVRTNLATAFTLDPIGAVIFARGECPDWITPMFRMTM